MLYANDSHTGTIDSYRIPFAMNEKPLAATAGPPYGAGVASDGRDLYVTAYNFNSIKRTGPIRTYALPLTNGEAASVAIAAVSPTAAGVYWRHLYIANYLENTVSVYDLPLRANSRPSACPVLNVASEREHVGGAQSLAIDSSNLYVSNGNNPIFVYPLPLSKGAQPSVTFLGVAPGDITVSRIPLKTGEKPAVTINTHYVWTGSLAAATGTDLYVSDVQRDAWDYALPLHAGERLGEPGNVASASIAGRETRSRLAPYIDREMHVPSVGLDGSGLRRGFGANPRQLR